MRVDVHELMKQAEVASPCSANWDEMTGDEKMRLCAQCNLHVLDASAMTDEEVLRAMQRTLQGEQVCMRFYRRADGRFLTKDCPVGWALVRKRAQQAARHAAAWLSGALAVVLSCAGSAGGANEKQKWHCRITGASAATATTAQKNNPSVEADTGAHFTDFAQGKLKFWTPEELASQDRTIEALKAQGLKASTADEIMGIVPNGFYCRTIAKNLGMYREALRIYEATNEWRMAAVVSSRLASLYESYDLQNAAVAAKLRRQADQNFARSAATTQSEKQAIGKLQEYEKAKSWSAAEELCIQLCADSISAYDDDRSSYWESRGRQYEALKAISASKKPPVAYEREWGHTQVWEKALKLANRK